MHPIMPPPANCNLRDYQESIMARQKIGIVSSYGVNCGNASYTHVLKEEFAKHFDVEVVPVNFGLLANAHPKASAAIKRHIRELCAKLATSDYVNIQFEAGLFGHSLANACGHVAPMIDASKNISFTVHRLHNPVQ